MRPRLRGEARRDTSAYRTLGMSRRTYLPGGSDLLLLRVGQGCWLPWRIAMHSRSRFMAPRTDQERDGASPEPVDPTAGMLVQIVADLSGSRDTQAVLRQVVDVGRSLGGADGALVLLYDTERDVFMPAVPGVAAADDERWLELHGPEVTQELARRAIAADDLLIAELTASSAGLRPLSPARWSSRGHCLGRALAGRAGRSRGTRAVPRATRWHGHRR